MRIYLHYIMGFFLFSSVFDAYSQQQVFSGWHTVHDVQMPTWDGKTLIFKESEEGSLAITALSNDVIRIRFSQASSFETKTIYLGQRKISGSRTNG